MGLKVASAHDARKNLFRCAEVFLQEPHDSGCPGLPAVILTFQLGIPFGALAGWEAWIVVREPCWSDLVPRCCGHTFLNPRIVKCFQQFHQLLCGFLIIVHSGCRKRASDQDLRHLQPIVHLGKAQKRLCPADCRIPAERPVPSKPGSSGSHSNKR